MKKIFNIVSITILASFLFSSVVLAADVPVKKAPEQAVLVVTVSIENAKIVSQEGNTFNISFDITNKQIPQADVRYGVRLIKESADGQILIDEKVYEDSFSLSENTSVSKKIIYQAPVFLSGSYILLLSSNNSGGLPLAMKNFGNVTLNSTIKGVEIIPESCTLSVVGEKVNRSYSLRQGVVIRDTENLKMSCTVVNSTESSVTLSPSFVTHITTSFGKVVETTGGDISPITLNKGEKKQVSFVLPKTTKIDNYSVSFLLKNETITSNSIIALYRIYGSNASISNLSLNKDYYKKGETAQVSLSWFFANNNNPYARINSKDAPSPVSLKLDFTNGAGKTCADSLNQNLSLDSKDSHISIPVLMKSTCKDPIVTATLLGSDGNIFDSKVFEFKSDMSKQLSNVFYIILIIVLLLIVALLLLCKKSNCKLCKMFAKDSTSMPMSVIFPFFIFIALSVFFSFSHEVQADNTYYVGTVSITINTPSYNSADVNVSFSGSTFSGQADSFQYSLLFYVTFDNLTKNLIDSSVANSHSSFSFGTTFANPTTPGTHNAVFEANSYYDVWTFVVDPLYTDGRGNWGWVNTGHPLSFSLPIVVPGGETIPTNAPTVVVKVNDSTSPDPILKSAAESSGVDVSWVAGGGAISCDCTYVDPSDNKTKSCGSGADKTLNGPFNIKVSKTTEFSVKCSGDTSTQQ